MAGGTDLPRLGLRQMPCLRRRSFAFTEIAERLMEHRGFTLRSQTESIRPAPDLVQRNFTPEAPDRLWVADITYVRTWEGWLYLSFVLETYSRKIVGWSMANHLR